MVEELDGILDADDVAAAVLVDVVDHGGERRGLPAAGGPGHEDEAPLLQGDALHDLGQAEAVDFRDLEWDAPHYDGGIATGAEDVDSEPGLAGQGMRYVQLLACVEGGLLGGGRELLDQLADVLGEKRTQTLGGDHGSGLAQERRAPGLEMDVAHVVGQEDRKELVHPPDVRHRAPP